MKLFRFESSETNHEKCGYCNWSATYLYWMSDTQENARREIADMGEDGNALCGSSMCDLLAEEGYDVTPPAVNVHCDGGTQSCDAAYLYELYWDCDKKQHQESNNSCMISAKIQPGDLIKLMNEFIDKNPNDFNIDDFLEYLDYHSIWHQIIAPDHSFYLGSKSKRPSEMNKSDSEKR